MEKGKQGRKVRVISGVLVAPNVYVSTTLTTISRVRFSSAVVALISVKSALALLERGCVFLLDSF